MVVSEDKSTDAVAVVPFLFVAIFVTFLCLWKLLPYRQGDENIRVRKPKRRNKRSSYKKIQQESPDEEATGLEKELSDQQEISSRNIVANVLHRIANSDLKCDNTKPQNLSQDPKMTRKKNSYKKKKLKKKNQTDRCDKTDNQAGNTTKNKRSQFFTCFSANYESDDDSGFTSNPRNCANNGTNRRSFNGAATSEEKLSPISRSVSLKVRGEKIRDHLSARVEQQSSKSIEVLERTVISKKTHQLRRTVSEETSAPYKSHSERCTRRRAESSQLSTPSRAKNEHSEHFEKSCQQKIQLTEHDLPSNSHIEGASQQRKHMEKRDVFLQNQSSVDASENFVSAEYANNGIGQKKADSMQYHTAAEVVNGHKSQKVNEKYVNENGSDEKIDSAMSAHYYENHRTKSMELSSVRNAPNVFDSHSENAEHEYIEMVSLHSKNHSVPDSVPIDEYSAKERRGEILMDEGTRKKMQLTQHDLHRGGINHQKNHVSNNHVFLHSNSPIDVPGNLAPAKHTTIGTVPKRVESRKCHMAAEAVDGYKSQKEYKNCGNENMSDERFDCAMPGQYYENYRIEPRKVYSEKKAPEVIYLPDENAWQEYTNMVPVRLENYSVSDPFPIDEYAAKEWRGETLMAERIRKGYRRVKEETGLTCIRQIRGDNYCALRAVLFKALSSGISILAGFQMNMRADDILHHLLSEQYHWITNWSFANRLTLLNGSFVDNMDSCLSYLSQIVDKSTQCFDDSQRYRMVLDMMNKEEENEVRIFEAVKFLMLYSSIQLYDKIQNQEFTLLGSLLFARDTSPDPEAFMKNHLNCVGDTAGIDQLEMMLLGQTLNVVIKVFRLHRVDKEDFIVQFPDDLENPEGTVELVAEDDRHYNVTSEEA